MSFIAQKVPNMEGSPVEFLDRIRSLQAQKASTLGYHWDAVSLATKYAIHCKMKVGNRSCSVE